MWPDLLRGRPELIQAAYALDSVLIELIFIAGPRASMWAAVDQLMDRAKAQGTMRADVTAADLRVLWIGVARVLTADGVEDPAAWRRYCTLALGALRA